MKRGSWKSRETKDRNPLLFIFFQSNGSLKRWKFYFIGIVVNCTCAQYTVDKSSHSSRFKIYDRIANGQCLCININVFILFITHMCSYFLTYSSFIYKCFVCMCGTQWLNWVILVNVRYFPLSRWCKHSRNAE